MVKKVNLITKRNDVVFLCRNLLPEAEIHVHSFADEHTKELSNIIVDASLFSSEASLINLVDYISPDEFVFLISTELDGFIQSKIDNDFRYKFRFPCRTQNLNLALENAEKNRITDLEDENYVDNRTSFYGFFDGISPAISKVRNQLRHAAKVNSPVLLLGETGTGKTTAAKLIHILSPRRTQKFILKSLPSIPETLTESEIFGVIKGAYTGIEETRDGIVKYAHQGTLFLDEIGTACLKQQKILLPLLDSGKIGKVGDVEKELIDVRWIFGTNIDIRKAMNDGTFCTDLFFRIKSNLIEIPPLRKHKEDIPFMAEHYLMKSNKKISQDGLEKLMSYNWPGNVREFNSCLENAKIKSSGEFVTAKDIVSGILWDK